MIIKDVITVGNIVIEDGLVEHVNQYIYSGQMIEIIV